MGIRCALRFGSGGGSRGDSRRNRLDGGIDADAAAIAVALELHHAVDQREQRVVLAEADVRPRMQLGSALAHQHAPGAHGLAAILFHAPALRVTVAPVARAANAFFVCHDTYLLRDWKARSALRPRYFQCEVWFRAGGGRSGDARSSWA